MDSVSPEELISLYFDGAATPSERQQAELLLSESAAARTWLSQLEQMRASLKSLPQQPMPADGFAHVMRQAEQQLLRVGSRAEEPSSAARGAGGGWPASRRQMWAALAVAAVALVVVVLPAYFSQRGPAGGVAFEERAAIPEPAAASARNHNERKELPAEAKVMRETGFQANGAPARTDPQAAEAVSANRHARKLFDEAPGDSARPLDRKMAPASEAPSTPAADEKPQTSYFAKSSVTESKPASGPGLSYVYNVPTPAAQQAVLETFEQTLREQQIVLEDSANPAPAGPTAAGSLGGLAGGGAGGAGLGTRAELLPAKRQMGQSPDRVYVIEATPLQLSNTLSTLNNMTVPAESEQSVQRVRVLEQVANDKQRLGEVSEKQRLGPTVADRPGSAASPAQASQGADSLTRMNRSQAYRFSTQFGEEHKAKGDVAAALTPGRQAGAMPAEPQLTKDVKKKPAPAAATAPAAPPSVAAGAPAMRAQAAQLKQQLDAAPRGEAAEQPASLQRAVIIFRVVPESAPKPAGLDEKQ